MGNCASLNDHEGNESVFPISVKHEQKVLSIPKCVDNVCVFSKENGVSGREKNGVVRIKILVSAQEFSELISEGHSEESIASLLIKKMEVEEEPNNNGRASRHSWRPSLEMIPEVVMEDSQ
ncbi:hypothetical protein SUGI_0329570 [Cryptomeria japonica]|nr:hypothetical protein SUGI_0329570 [Cryptomeria japonica]